MKSDYTSSIKFDKRLYKQDIQGSIAHVNMLSKQSIIKEKEASQIVNGLMEIKIEIESGDFPWKDELEDIHMNIENRLFIKIGDVAGKLHTARSRNDQIALDLRMYVKDVIKDVFSALKLLRNSFIKMSELNSRIILPGYTHLQRAQPVLFSHHMMAYFQMFNRDYQRFLETYKRVDVLPLGSGALAGVPYPIDRQSVAEELGFSSLTVNSMDAVSDRDFLLDFQSAASICMMHISRLSEELIIWNSEEFKFIEISEDYITGSSIMPQKRNPDFLELARGKTGRVYGGLISLLTIMKSLPLTYNRDMQEDKIPFFDTSDTLLSTLYVLADLIVNIKINSKNMILATDQGNILATDIADYLVNKGMPFREAHSIVSKLSSIASSKGKKFSELPLSSYKELSDLFDSDVLEINLEKSISSRDIPGGTSYNQVEESILNAKNLLEDEGYV